MLFILLEFFMCKWCPHILYLGISYVGGFVFVWCWIYVLESVFIVIKSL